jgi:hypothetical protein
VSAWLVPEVTAALTTINPASPAEKDAPIDEMLQLRGVWALGMPPRTGDKLQAVPTAEEVTLEAVCL